jgi:outer membrane protein assembly factor BamB
MKPLRLWPGIALVAVQLISFVVISPMTADADLPYGLMGGVLASLLIWVWWLLFSRAPWLERLGAIVLLVIAVIGSGPLVDQSISGAGQGYLMYALGIVPTAMALVAWAALTRNLRGGLRWVTLAAAILIGIMPFHLVRTPGVGGGSLFALHWRWTPTPEDLLLAQGPEQLKPLPPLPAAVAEPAKAAAASPEKPVAVTAPAETIEQTAEAAAPPIEDGPAEWPGFRGANRDSVVRGVRINTDWAASPPVQMWRRPIGPGWSSFSVRGDVLYTQEQRGNEEIVAAYRVSTGEPVWRHADPVRFYESNGGAGPRGTPTIHKDRVYSMGATGILNALDARTGKKVWSNNTSADTSRDVPYWGISSSPLIVEDVVIVSVGGTLSGYDLATGKQRWVGPLHGGSYSSPHLVTIDGVRQVVILSAPGAVSVDPADGKLLWDYKWEGGAIIQPGVTEDGDILINAMSATGGGGTRRLAVKHDAGGWTPEERWTTIGLKPYFNDYVLHKGHAYGFDNNILAAIDLADGKRKWKGGRYGNGQLVLLADQDLLLVISEEGELALVSATTDQFKEIARMPVFDSKTWNHPVVVGNVLLVRNGVEMAAFRLAAEGARSSDER